MKKANNNKAKIVQLVFQVSSFRRRNGYVFSDRYRDKMPISENGIHYGYLYEGMVYCNVYPEGMPEEKWEMRFYDFFGKYILKNYF